ncbi:hypothetical protein EDD65_102103 [Keratinibaculum paraultunense]|uniref:Uncharacterized protein n=1 Tax=Keratinibaculum paraultunense TaxID=1278232 RepID=A0A4V2UUK0_9FIRM|nr:hypothetical protein [Keratinibaculum paraultunense]QQY80456.1 hypothetical protein JL105_03900 [Keratinibaculum paraultunense]TCS91174.1 hypothetical protein EDD65_102103 [Keratinibaculum paraultunense]
METRIEKRKRQKKEKRIKRCRVIILFSTLLFLYMGIKIVNDNIIHLGYLDNPTIFNMNIKQNRLELFGENYIIDLKVLKKED